MMMIFLSLRLFLSFDNNHVLFSLRRGPWHLRTSHDHDLHPAHHGHPPLLTAHGSESRPGVSSLSSTSGSPSRMQLKTLQPWSNILKLRLSYVIKSCHWMNKTRRATYRPLQFFCPLSWQLLYKLFIVLNMAFISESESVRSVISYVYNLFRGFLYIILFTKEICQEVEKLHNLDWWRKQPCWS